MAPPNRILRPDDFQTQLDALAQRIKDLETAPSLSFSSIKEGSTVILDSTGAKRVILGKDPSDGAYGVKVFDATGALIVDATGLRQVWTPLTSADANPQNQSITATAAADITGANSSFTISRAQDIRLEFLFTAKTSGAVGQYGFCLVYIGTTPSTAIYSTGTLIYDKGNAGYMNAYSTALFRNVPAGTYRAAMAAYVDSGQTLAVFQSHLDVFRLGG